MVDAYRGFLTRHVYIQQVLLPVTVHGRGRYKEAAPAREDVKTGKLFTAARRCWLSGRVDDIFVAQVERNHRNIFL